MSHFTFLFTFDKYFSNGNDLNPVCATKQCINNCLFNIKSVINAEMKYTITMKVYQNNRINWVFKLSHGWTFNVYVINKIINFQSLTCDINFYIFFLIMINENHTKIQYMCSLNQLTKVKSILISHSHCRSMLALLSDTIDFYPMLNSSTADG